MKDHVLIFAGEDEAAARSLVPHWQAQGKTAIVVSSFAFQGAEECERIEIMHDVPEFVARKIRDAFPGKYERRPVEAPSHTDLMVTPESIDAFIEANPPPVKRRGRPRKVAA